MSDSSSNKDFLSELSDLESQLPEYAFEQLDFDNDEGFDSISTFAAIYTPISDVLMIAALCRAREIHCKIMSNSEFGTIAFLEDTLKDEVDEAAYNLTEYAPKTFEICVFRYEFDSLVAEIWRAGKCEQKIVPPIALSNLSETAELAILSQVDFFDPRTKETFDVFEVTAPELVPSISKTKAMRAKSPDVLPVDKDDVFIFDSNLVSEDDIQAIQINFFRNFRKR